MDKGHRQERLGEEIKKIISELLLKELKDPRLSAMISVTAVEVTSDGSYATAFLSVLGLNPKSDTAEEQQDVLDAMNRAKGFIRKEIGHKVRIRHVPDLIFKIDKSLEYGRHIDEIIDNLDIKHDDNDPEAEK